MSIIQGNVVGGDIQYQISRSLRFNSADSAYLDRTPASASNRKTWTWSAWVKRSGLSANGNLFGGAFSSASDRLLFEGSDKLWFIWDDTTDGQLLTTQVFRDVSAWYHIVIASDTTQATASNRMKFYVNGVQITIFDTATYPSQNRDGGVNNTTVQKIGVVPHTNSQYFNGYLTEVNFIDGSALDPTSFGEYNEDTGVWQPKAYTGTYGTNGFYLNFSDNTSTTTLGDDLSGNGNDWTTNNFSVTAGAGNDSLVDTPTNYGTDTGVGGEVRGNYATLNPLDVRNGTFSNGNLNGTASAGDNGENVLVATIAMTSGKWYCEVLVGSGGAHMIGIADSSKALSTRSWQGANGWYYHINGQKYNAGSGTTYGATYTANDIIGVAYDADAGSLSFYKNGVSQGVAFNSGLVGKPMVFALGSGTNSFAQVFDCNFGQRPFAYTAPSGFKALCTQNLPEPTIVDGGEYFNTVLYTGTGSSGLAVTGVGFQPDWVWIKSRNNAVNHNVYDAVRGVYNRLETNNTNTETFSTASLTSFDSDGFTVDAGSGRWNASGYTYVAWNWKANGAGVSNTDGTITSTVSANTDSGFSIVTYTGNATAGATVGHGLGVAPAMIIVKDRDGAYDWYVYHDALAVTNVLRLSDTTGAYADQQFNQQDPTSSIFYLGNNVASNTSGHRYVTYCFAAIPGYSAFGSYSGSGSQPGPFTYLGFKPAFIIIKESNGVDGWGLYDDGRDTYNPVSYLLQAQDSGAESSASANKIDFLSNGFRVCTDGTQGNFINESGKTYIYAAWASNPFKYSLAR